MAETSPVGTLTVSEVRTLAEVGPRAWDALAAAYSPFASYAWLRFIEERVRMSVRYLLWQDRGELVAALPTYSGGPDVTPRPFTLAEVMRTGAEVPAGHGVLGGAAYGYHNDGLLIRAGLPAPERARLAQLMVTEFGDFTRSAGAAYSAFLCVPERPLAELAEAGYGHPSALLLNTVATLRLPAPAFDDYLSALPGRRRLEIRRERRIFQQSGLAWMPGKVPAELTEVAELIEATYRHHGYPAGDPADRRHALETQFRWFGADTMLLVCRANGRLVGAVSGFARGRDWVVPWLGMDYAIARKTALYFNLAYYLPIEYVLSRGGTSIDFGVSALHAKVLRGMSLEPKWGLVQLPANLESGWRGAAREHNGRCVQDLTASEGSRVAGLIADRWHPLAPLPVPHP
jgi:predicted N-acyltransferase